MKLYIGHFNNNIIAISQHKKVLNHYLTYNREFSMNQIEITESNIDENQLLNFYSEFLLVEFYNIYLTTLDISIIDFEYAGLYDEFQFIINKLKYITFLLNNIKKTKRDITLFISIINKLIIYINTKKIFNKINKIHYMQHPIIKCDYEAYNIMVQRYREHQDMMTRYKLKIISEDS